MYDFKEKSKKS